MKLFLKSCLRLIKGTVLVGIAYAMMKCCQVCLEAERKTLSKTES